ncbi:ECF transporter S component [Clostridium hydrogenum]|uniref:ECF transporter S component n=1 Tax=Clostridium hydrogenum TaxID=2855764 RepID=UPI001F48522F|nr:ECF transporter S component [Clostridium hydrogenum]
MEQKTFNTSYAVRDIAQISLMAAIVFVATKLTGIPVGLGYKGFVHAGDAMVFVAAIILRRKNAVIASALGMGLFDLLSTAPAWAPFTLIIKGVMAYLAATIAYRNNYNGESIVNNIFGFIVGGIWMIGAYYFAGVFLDHYLMGFPWSQCWILQATHIGEDVAQVIVGMIIAVPLSKVLKRIKYFREM